MSKYIGTPVVNVSVDTVDVTGDITTTDTTPEVIIVNNTHEDTDGGREGKVTFKGQQSGGEETTLAQIQASHDGTSDDEKGDLIFKTNDGSDGASPTEAMRITSAQKVGFGASDPLGQVTIAKESGSNAPTSVTAANTYLQLGSDDFGPSNNGKFMIGFGYTDAINTNSPAYIGFEETSTSGDTKGNLTFYTRDVVTDTAPTERMRISANGEVDIGVQSGTGTLKIQSSGNQGLILRQNTTVDRFKLFVGDGTGGYTADENFISSNNTNLRFYAGGTGTTEVMRLDSNGNLLVNSTNSSPNGKIYVETASGQYGLVVDDTFGNNVLIQFKNGGVVTGTIHHNNLGTTSYNTTSDYRLKENVTVITDGITRVKQLSPKQFNFIAYPDNTIDGFIAHEVQNVVPLAITGKHNEVEVWAEGEELPDGVSVGDNKLDDDGNTIPVYQGIDQAKLVPLLTAALQEAIAKIETLETQNTTQATQIADLITRVTALEGE